jgi:chemotaxis protein MotB
LEAEEIATELAGKLGTGLDNLEASIEVRKIDEGILISLTDKQSFGMFQSGSAEPQPELVRLVETIATVLASRGGYIVVRGHTDSIPYRNKKYDNWQLSTARAHLAQYMLVRGGLDESRIRRVEGLADRDPKNPGDPQAPENRRIEILLGHDS